MKRAIFLGHLGLGDHLILNGLIRHIALSWDTLIILAKHHNVASCRFMWSDLTNVHVLGVADDHEAIGFCHQGNGFKILHSGHFGKGFNIERWDQSFYEQAGVPFEQSWDGWKVPECNHPIKPPDEPYIFVHEDDKRGYWINSALVPCDLLHVSNTDFDTKNIFEWIEVLRNATEIHVMESCFAILADRLDGLKAHRFVIHAYMRNSRPPVYRKNWEILK